MTKKSPLNPARTRTGRHKTPPALAASPRARTPKLTRAEALEIGRTPWELRKAWRRMLQKRRIAQRQRDKKKAALESQRRLASATTWRLPPEPEPRYEPTVAEAEEQPMSSPRPEPVPAVPRRAVRAESPSPRTVHGRNRCGESARSWGEGKGGTRVPLDISNWLREEF